MNSATKLAQMKRLKKTGLQDQKSLLSVQQAAVAQESNTNHAPGFQYEYDDKCSHTSVAK